MMLIFKEKKNSFYKNGKQKKYNTPPLIILLDIPPPNIMLMDILILKDKGKQKFNNYCHSSNTSPLIILLFDNKQKPMNQKS